MSSFYKSAWITLLMVFAAAAQAADAPKILDVYAHLTGRTLLLGSLPARLNGISAPSLEDTNKAMAFIEGQLRDLQIEAVPDGQKFIQLLPVNWRGTPLAAQLDRLKIPAEDISESKFPSSCINFENVDLDQVIEIYSHIRQRTVLRPGVLPNASFNFRTQTSLTKDETVYALNVLLTLNGFAEVDDGDKLVQLVPLDQVSRVQARAPKAADNESLITPGQVNIALAQTNSPPDGRPRHLGVPQLTANRLAAYYAELSGCQFIPPARNFQDHLVFETVTPLSREELLYAISKTLELNRRQMVKLDDKSMTLNFLPEKH